MAIVVWIAPFSDGQALALPFVGLAVHIAGTFLGWLGARIAGASPPTQGTLILAGACSNVLTFGGITIVLLLSSDADPDAETAFCRLAIYRLLEAPYYYIFVWPLAAAIGHARAGPVPWSKRLAKAFSGPTLAPAIGILVGLVLNASGVPRPSVFDGTATVLVRINVVLLGFTVGLGLRRATISTHLGACIAVSAVKFLVMPAVGVGLAWILGSDARTLQVIAIGASMPVAFMAVIGANLYDLDEDLVSSLWLFTTVAMIVVVPLLAIVVPLLGDATA
jgi:hypothetical protein